VHALLIGIDTYRTANFRPLSGAVSDTKKIESFLKKNIAGPSIRMLLNEQATQRGILRAVEGLASDSNINKGDPILIYYAGHGSTVDAPRGKSHTSQKIQVLVPYDGRVDGSTAQNFLADFKLGRLVAAIADAKGDNITVILDCCYAASGTRG
ncbi:peptidase C14, caspase domain-containing protein, partial [Vararia minispora EC-137]